MKKGFTLIELLIVIAIIAILAGVVFVALDPGKRFADARNSARWTDVTAVLSAIKVDQVDNGGSYLTPAITDLTDNTNYIISADTVAPITGCDTSCSVTTAVDCVSLDGLKQEGYLANIPVSPKGVTTWSTAKTGYYIFKSDLGSITTGACDAEDNETISVSR